MKITIANRFTGVEIFSIDEDEATVAKALLAAIKSGADLSRADLSGAKIDGEEISVAPLAVSGLHWWVLITEGYMRIGYQRHTHKEWADFTEAEIAGMDGNAAEFWRTWEVPLMAMCEQHAAAAKAKAAA